MQALADFPATIFCDELLSAYPDAKIIVSTREEDKWVSSMESTLIHAYNKQHFAASDTKTPLRLMAEKYHELCWKNDFGMYGRAYFKSYYEELDRCIAGQHRPAIRYTVGQVWEPLCKFLDRPVPEKPFPRSDDWTKYKAAVAE